MSRYIRTKNHIINVGKHKIIKRACDGVYYRNSDKEVWFVIYTEDIIKEADTIEELCDCFVYKQKGEHLPQVFFKNPIEIMRDEKWVEAFVREMVKRGTEYWTSIWVGGNLIKVAKMNEKGELELL